MIVIVKLVTKNQMMLAAYQANLVEIETFKSCSGES